jgi:hypothetical protein
VSRKWLDDLMVLGHATLVASQAVLGIFEMLAESTAAFHIGNPTELDISLRGDWRVRYRSLLWATSGLPKVRPLPDHGGWLNRKWPLSW